ncbi:hypothetical protein LJR251_001916 [Rhizobium rhizogenes]|jgi:hypothetical protein|uniref:hypothetical protein n=1 Tax=Rhizobium rhizogenes TaxID=359 RepID=UPI003ECC344B
MKDSHGFSQPGIVQKRIVQLLQALPCLQKSDREDKVARENILSLSDHLKRDAGLDHILDDQ